MEKEMNQEKKIDGMNIYEKIGLKSYRGNYFRCFLLVVVLLITYWFVSSQWTLYVEKEKILEYLQEKYGKKFVITETHTERKGLGSPLEVHATLYPEEDISVVFHVSKSVEGERSSARYFSDGYLTALWSKQAQSIVNDYFSAHSMDMPEVEAEVGIDFKVKKLIQGETPTLADALKKYGNDMSYGLTVRVDGDFNETTKIKYANQIMAMIGFFRENSDIGKPHIRYYVNAEYKNSKVLVEYFWVLSPEQIKRITNVEELFPLINKRVY